MDINNLFFSPLSRKYCDWFYFTMVFCLLLVFLQIGSMIMKRKKITALDWGVLLNAAALYLTQRLFYSICTR